MNAAQVRAGAIVEQLRKLSLGLGDVPEGALLVALSGGSAALDGPFMDLERRARPLLLCACELGLCDPPELPALKSILHNSTTPLCDAAKYLEHATPEVYKTALATADIQMPELAARTILADIITSQKACNARPERATSETPTEGAADSEPADRSDLAASRVKAAAVYDWAIQTIPEADKMPILDLFPAILEKLDAAIAATPKGAKGEEEAEKLQELRDSLPPNAETFGKYLRDAGIKRYNAKGERTRRISRFPRQNQF